MNRHYTVKTTLYSTERQHLINLLTQGRFFAAWAGTPSTYPPHADRVAYARAARAFNKVSAEALARRAAELAEGGDSERLARLTERLSAAARLTGEAGRSARHRSEREHFNFIVRRANGTPRGYGRDHVRPIRLV